MPLNQLKFIKKMLDKFIIEYPNLDPDIIADIIATILLDAPSQYFTYDMVQENPNLCAKCGACCKQRNVKCKYFNGRTCDEYATRYDVCAEFPYYEIDGEEGLMLDPGCKFAIRLAEQEIRKDIERFLNEINV